MTATEAAPNPGDIYERADAKPWLVLRADKAHALLLTGDGTLGTPTTYRPYTELDGGTYRPATVPELHRAARGIFAFLGRRPAAYVTGYDRELFDRAGDLLALAEARSGGCPHGDPFCPCRDGLDECHYEGVDPAPCPRTRVVGCDCRARRVA